MWKKSSWLVMGAALACAFAFTGDAAAQRLMAIKTKPSTPTLLTTKLTPDLAAIVAAKTDKARLVGMSVQGEAIVEIPGNVTVADAVSKLAEGPRNVDIQERGEKLAYEKATELIVVYSGKQAPKTVGGMKVVDSHPEGQFVVVQSDTGFTGEQIEKLAADEEVRLVQPNYLYKLVDQEAQPAATLIPNDPLFPKLWGMKNIHAPTAWSKIHQSPVKVAVVDTGIDLKHKDLDGNILPNYSKDFTPDGSVMDTNGHGTHCAGTIAGEGNNKLGVPGVIWKGRIFAVKIFGKSGFAGDTQVAKGIDYAVAKGAKVLSNSWGGGAASPVLQGAIARADLKGVLFIAAAGNGGPDQVGDNNDATPFYPASYPNKNIISVMAINEKEKMPIFTNYGKTTVDIAAPGVDILSTIPGSNYGTKSGTSMATPHVAGAAALIWGHPKYQSYSHTQIKSLILKNARPLSDLKGKCVTGGTLDIAFLGALSVAPSIAETDTNKKSGR